VPLSTKQEIIDVIVAEATRLFTGDDRDGEAPPITLQNFYDESFRYGAKALRERLQRLSDAEFWSEVEAAAAHLAALEKYKNEIHAFYERQEREDAAQKLRQQQQERGRRHGLQPAIFKAARHYRGEGMNAGEAWDAIKEHPFRTDDGETVEIQGRKGSRLEQKMRVVSRDGRQPKSAIQFAQWRQRYWTAVAKPG
jgi:hypothetical protein